MSGPLRGRTPPARRPVETRPFFRLVYKIVCAVPKGKVVTYGQVASLAGRPHAARAVGMALGAPRGPLLPVTAAVPPASADDPFRAHSPMSDLYRRLLASGHAIE